MNKKLVLGIGIISVVLGIIGVTAFMLISQEEENIKIEVEDDFFIKEKEEIKSLEDMGIFLEEPDTMEEKEEKDVFTTGPLVG